MSNARRRGPYAARPLRRRARSMATRVRSANSSTGSRLSSAASRSCAARSTTAAFPRRASSRDRRALLDAAAGVSPVAARRCSSMLAERRPARAAAGDRRGFHARAARALRASSKREVTTAVPLTRRDRAARWRRALAQATGQRRRLDTRTSIRRSSAASSRGSAAGLRRQRRASARRLREQLIEQANARQADRVDRSGARRAPIETQTIHEAQRERWTSKQKTSPASSASRSAASRPTWTWPKSAPSSPSATASRASTASSAPWPAR